ncbi:MAG: hypothetical protein KDB14_00015 [Planctomycetales bacterium]|nr:hypothetical protein [Planctomycetales bacterium]
MVQHQGVEVIGLHVRHHVRCGGGSPAERAARLGIELVTRDNSDVWGQSVLLPRFGYGREANPCRDCRAGMLVLAREVAQARAASFVVTGEILGQRAWGQSRRDLDMLAYHSGLEGRLLRPLSALKLAPTDVELRGEIDRTLLGNLHGPGRSGLLKLARRLMPGALTEADRAGVREAGCELSRRGSLQRVDQYKRWLASLPCQPAGSAAARDLAIVLTGRLIELPGGLACVGRNERECARLEHLLAAGTEPAVPLRHVIRPAAGQRGPTAIVFGGLADARQLLLQLDATGEKLELVTQPT